MAQQFSDTDAIDEEQADHPRSLVVPKRSRELDAQGPSPEDPAILTTASAAIAQTLANLGTIRVFGIPGGPISPVVDALLDTDIEHITCQHENMAVYAAGAEGLARNKPGVVAVTSGPGVLNAMTGLAACYHDQMPLVLLVGEVATDNQGRGALQDGSEHALHISQMVRSISKKAMLIEQPERAAEDIAEAWRVALKPPFGPVVVRIPVDIASRNVTCGPAKENPRLAKPRSVRLAELKNVAELLRQAKRPVLFVGGGVCRAKAYEQVRSLAESVRAAVMTDLEAKGAFPESHPQSLGIFGVGGDGRAQSYVAEADLVISLGARLDDTTTANFSPLLQPQGGTLVQIDEDALRLGRSYEPQIAIAGALALTCEKLEKATGELERTYPSIDPKPAPNAEIALPPYPPVAAIAALQRKLPSDTIFVSDIGNHLLFAAQALTLDRPGCFHASLGLGGMGSGIGAAIGLQIAHGAKHQVVCICGDGSYLMSGNEIATCARYQIPVIFLVVNDRQLGMVQHGAERVYGRAHRWESPELNVHDHAASLGIHCGTFRDLDSILDDMLRTGPAVIDLPISPNEKAFNPRDATLFTSEEGPPPKHSSVNLKSPTTTLKEAAS